MVEEAAALTNLTQYLQGPAPQAAAARDLFMLLERIAITLGPGPTDLHERYVISWIAGRLVHGGSFGIIVIMLNAVDTLPQSSNSGGVRLEFINAGPRWGLGGYELHSVQRI